jgi:hypothetical protein
MNPYQLHGAGLQWQNCREIYTAFSSDCLCKAPKGVVFQRYYNISNSRFIWQENLTIANPQNRPHNIKRKIEADSKYYKLCHLLRLATYTGIIAFAQLHSSHSSHSSHSLEFQLQFLEDHILQVLQTKPTIEFGKRLQQLETSSLMKIVN